MSEGKQVTLAQVSKSYPPELVMTPRDRPAGLPGAAGYLTPGVTRLQERSKEMSDNQAAAA